MQTSESTIEIDAAYAKAQAMMTSAEKSGVGQVGGKTGEARKFGYSTIDAVIEAIRIPFTSNGLSWKQFIGRPIPFPGGYDYPLVTRISHASGEFYEEVTSLLVTSFDPKIVGSTITYFRRYCLMAICGLAPDDDDGDAASKAARDHKPQARQSQQPDPESEGLRAAITAYLESLTATARAKVEKSLAKGVSVAEWSIGILNALDVQSLRNIHANIAKWQASKLIDNAPATEPAPAAELTDEEKAAIIAQEAADAAQSAAAAYVPDDDPFKD